MVNMYIYAAASGLYGGTGVDVVTQRHCHVAITAILACRQIIATYECPPHTIFRLRASRDGIVDTVAAAPLIWVVLIMNATGSAGLSEQVNFSLFLMNHLLRIIHIKRFGALFEFYCQRSKHLNHVGVQRMWVLFFLMALVAHWMGCLFYYVSRRWAGQCTEGSFSNKDILEDDEGHEISLESFFVNTWGEVDGLWKVQYDDVYAYNATHAGVGRVVMLKPLSYRYLRALYWAMITMVTTGFGDVVPQNESETAVCIATMYCGVLITTSAIANLTMMVTNLDKAETKFEQSKDMMNKYLHVQNLSPKLSNRIRNYQDYMWFLLKGADEQEILNELPYPLQFRLINFVTKDIFKHCHILKAAPPSLLNHISTVLEQSILSPGDIIIHKGDQYQGLYMLARGEADILSTSNRTSNDGVSRAAVLDVLKQNSHIGGISLFEDQQAHNTVMARTFSELYVLNRPQFQELCYHHCSSSDVSSMQKIAVKQQLNSVKTSKLFGMSNGDSSHVIIRNILGKHAKPSSKFRIFWERTLLGMCIFYGVSVPLHVAYVMDNGGSGEPAAFFDSTIQAIHWILGYLFDVFFVIHIVLEARYFAFFELTVGIIVSDPELIRERYVKGNYRLHILMAFPYEMLACGILAVFSSLDNSGNVLLALRLARLPKFLHIGSVHNHYQVILLQLEKSDQAIGRAARRIITLNFIMLLVCHLAACAWVFAAYLSISLDDGTAGTQRSWILEENESVQAAEYPRAFYWAIVAMSTVGYGDIIPYNWVETLTATLVVYFGGLVLPAVL